MKVAQDLLPEPPVSPMTRASSVHIGREDFVSVLLRLIGMELYKIRRRMMSKVLIIIGVIATIGLFALIALAAFLTIKNGTTVEEIQLFTQSLRLPGSLSVVVQLLMTLGEILIIILVSTIVGGEYTSGTIRLMLTRGPTRTQILLAKAGTAVVCIVFGVIGIILLGVLTGMLLNIWTGIPQNLDFLNAAWLGHMLLYLLIVMLGLTMYAMMALCLSTLGRATAAGLAGVLTWSFLIEPVVEALSFLKNIGGAAGSVFQSLPDYLIGTNITTLLQNQGQYLFPSQASLQPPPQSDLHALLVLAVYLLIFLGAAWWISVRRDVTN
jgi:ABC-type transport system involved in multi-copper enzyme maturation permease subunit